MVEHTKLLINEYHIHHCQIGGLLNSCNFPLAKQTNIKYPDIVTPVKRSMTWWLRNLFLHRFRRRIVEVGLVGMSKFFALIFLCFYVIKHWLTLYVVNCSLWRCDIQSQNFIIDWLILLQDRSLHQTFTWYAGWTTLSVVCAVAWVK